MSRIALCALLLLTSGCELDGLDAPTGEESSPLDDASSGGATGANECAPVQALTCGATVSGDTRDPNSGTTTELDGYPVAVGNYDAPEVVYSFSAPTAGPVTFELIDPVPTEVDHDVFVLEGYDGCRAASAIERGFNSVTFEAEAGASYYLVIDGFGGDAGAFAAALSCEGGAVSEPDPETYGECVFGQVSRDLADAEHLTRTQVGQYEAFAELPELVGQQMWEGVEQDGWGWFADLPELWDNVDDDGVYETQVVDQATGAAYTWLRWYAGDTEVGYLFVEGTLELVAKIGDGDIYDCER